MSTFPALLSGEIQRLQKYNILAASVVVALLWIGVLYFIEIEDVTAIFPLLLFIDVTSMAILLVGVTLFFEKQEGTLRSLLVSPISKGEYVLAKASANIVSHLGTLALLYLYVWYFKESTLNLAVLVIAVMLASLFHSVLGVVLSYYSKDFTDLLMNMFKYIVVMALPVILEQFGVITNEVVGYILYALPTKASLTLLMASASTVESWEVILSAAYLVLAIGVMWFVAMRKFDEFAAKESGS